MDGADRKAWFDAEHVETEERALDGDTEPESEDSREQLEADIEEWASIMDLEDQIDMIHGWLNRRAKIMERKMVEMNQRYFDCVEQEKKIAELTRKMEILKAHGVEIVDAVAGGYEVYNEKIREVSELQEKVGKLTAERDKLQEQLRIGWECECKLQAERDDWKEHSRTIEYRCKKAETDCEIYRKKFGKCIDYADAIHALMDDEGMA